MQRILSFLLLFAIFSCTATRKSGSPDSRNTAIKSTVVIKKKVPPRTINTRNVSVDSLVQFAEKFIGVPYKYGGTNPDKGFDCSGFVYYVFNKFKITVPRTSSEFTNAGYEVNIKDSQRGDIILFTGSDPNSGVVGHMGIITSNKNNRIEFIHAASGEGGGVMISGMNSYFIPRFVKVNRVFRIT